MQEQKEKESKTERTVDALENMSEMGGEITSSSNPNKAQFSSRQTSTFGVIERLIRTALDQSKGKSIALSFVSFIVLGVIFSGLSIPVVPALAAVFAGGVGTGLAGLDEWSVGVAATVFFGITAIFSGSLLLLGASLLLLPLAPVLGAYGSKLGQSLKSD